MLCREGARRALCQLDNTRPLRDCFNVWFKLEKPYFYTILLYVEMRTLKVELARQDLNPEKLLPIPASRNLTLDKALLLKSTLSLKWS